VADVFGLDVAVDVGLSVTTGKVSGSIEAVVGVAAAAEDGVLSFGGFKMVSAAVRA
jgi:hypothetical protein